MSVFGVWNVHKDVTFFTVVVDGMQCLLDQSVVTHSEYVPDPASVVYALESSEGGRMFLCWPVVASSCIERCVMWETMDAFAPLMILQVVGSSIQASDPYVSIEQHAER